MTNEQNYVNVYRLDDSISVSAPRQNLVYDRYAEGSATRALAKVQP